MNPAAPEKTAPIRKSDRALEDLERRSDRDQEREDGRDRLPTVVILAFEEGHRAFLNRGRDLAHAIVAVGLL